MALLCDLLFAEKIYVSYYPDSKKYRSSLLNLVAKLRRLYAVNLIMDSYCETGIAELGIARWCQMQLSESTRVLMVISKEYLKVGSFIIVDFVVIEVMGVETSPAVICQERLFKSLLIMFLYSE